MSGKKIFLCFSLMSCTAVAQVKVHHPPVDCSSVCAIECPVTKTEEYNQWSGTKPLND